MDSGQKDKAHLRILSAPPPEQQFEGDEELLSLGEFLNEILDKTNTSATITLREFLAEVLGKEDNHRPLTLKEFLNLTPDDVTVASSDQSGTNISVATDVGSEELRAFRLRRLAEAAEILDSFSKQRRISHDSRNISKSGSLVTMQERKLSTRKRTLSQESITLLDFLRESRINAEPGGDGERKISYLAPTRMKSAEEAVLSSISRLRNISDASHSSILDSIIDEKTGKPIGDVNIEGFLEEIINNDVPEQERKISLRMIVEMDS